MKSPKTESALSNAASASLHLALYRRRLPGLLSLAAGGSLSGRLPASHACASRTARSAWPDSRRASQSKAGTSSLAGKPEKSQSSRFKSMMALTYSTDRHSLSVHNLPLAQLRQERHLCRTQHQKKLKPRMGGIFDEHPS